MTLHSRILARRGLQASLPLLFTLLAACGGNPGSGSSSSGSSRDDTTVPTVPTVPKADCGAASVSPTASADTGFYEPLNVSGGTSPEGVADGLSEHPSITVLPQGAGHVYVAWDDNTSGEKEVLFSHSIDAGVHFSGPLNLSASGTAHFPSAVASSDGTIHVAWEDTRTGTAQIFYARSEDGGTSFSAATNLSHSTAAARSVNLAVGSDGTLYVTWVSELGLVVARSTDAGAHFSFYASYAAASSSTPASPSTAVDSAGMLHLTWSETTPDSSSSIGVTRSIHYAQAAADSGTLSTSQTLAQGNTLSQPVVAADGSGNVYVAYRNEDDKDLYLARSTDSGAAFATPQNITHNSGTSLDPSLVVDDEGTLYLVWTDTSDGNYDSFFASSSDHGLSFSAPLNFAPSAQGSLFTAVAVDSEHNVYAAWDDNRFPSSDNAISNEGNFEILVSRGRRGLPAVQGVTLEHCPFSPNADGTQDSTTFAAVFSKTLASWNIDIFNTDGGRVHSVSSSSPEAALSYSWDGKANQLDNAVAPDGEYHYVISGSDADGFAALSASGALIVNTASDTTLPAILTDSSGASSFLREAFAFSPNGDGFKDTDGVSARFNKPVNWTLAIVDATDKTRKALRSFSGSGLSIDPETIYWDGKDGSGAVLADGSYRLNLSIVDGQGQKASCGAAPITCPTMEVDTVRPALTNPNVTASFTPGAGEKATVSATATETALVTIYAYAHGGTQVRSISRAYHDANTPFALDWDGKDNAGNLVAPGDYVINVWCRDRAGNTAVTYPYELNVTVKGTP